jgi:hypothetical protein
MVCILLHEDLAAVGVGMVTLQELVMFDAVPAKAVTALTGLPASLTALTLGADPSLHTDGAKNLQLEKTRTCSTLFRSLADACNLKTLAVPCTGDVSCSGR